MQRPDEKKRRDILKVAERLFATRPFHEVKLDEVAARCRIGKGTIYIYFKSKDDLYACMVREGMDALVADLKHRLADSGRYAMDDLRTVVAAIMDYAAQRPRMFQLMRMISSRQTEQEIRESRAAMAALICKVIERGVANSEMIDPHPHLTAQYLLGAMRGGLLFGDASDPSVLVDHLLHVFGTGLQERKRRRS